MLPIISVGKEHTLQQDLQNGKVSRLMQRYCFINENVHPPCFKEYVWLQTTQTQPEANWFTKHCFSSEQSEFTGRLSVWPAPIRTCFKN